MISLRLSQDKYEFFKTQHGDGARNISDFARSALLLMTNGPAPSQDSSAAFTGLHDRVAALESHVELLVQSTLEDLMQTSCLPNRRACAAYPAGAVVTLRTKSH
jgi:hypothetical protein